MAFAATIQKVFPSFDTDLTLQMEQDAMFRQIPAGSELIRPGQFIRSTRLVVSGLRKEYREAGEGNEFFL